jgi:hypothetical protein
MGFLKQAIVALAAFSTSQAFAIGNIANLEIVDRATGRALPVHMQDGEAWVAGTPGAKYSIRLRNNQWGRVLAVMSVDGVNVLSGDTAASAQTGYVYGRFESGDIAGWRKSDSEIAAFEFVASPQSYAERTGRPDHVGVIGVALFREKARITRKHFAPEPLANIVPAPAPSSAPLARRDSASAAPAEMSKSRERALADESDMKLGTGHGEREASHITRVEFTRESDSPNEIIRIRYDSRENLIARGIISAKYAWRNPFPSAFPRDSYVPDPPAMR